MTFGNGVLVFLAILIIYVIYLGIKIVPQSKVFVIERFGKFTRILESGLSIIVPFVDRVAFKVDILERQLPPFKMSVITEDNVEVELVSTVFFRVLDAAKSVYRIRNIDLAIENTAISIIRSAAGKLELDDLQSSREAMNQEIAARLTKAAEVWGVEVTRTEILDVLVYMTGFVWKLEIWNPNNDVSKIEFLVGISHSELQLLNIMSLLKNVKF